MLHLRSCFIELIALQWDMPNATHNREPKRYSETFVIGGYPWYVTFKLVSQHVSKYSMYSSESPCPILNMAQCSCLQVQAHSLLPTWQ